MPQQFSVASLEIDFNASKFVKVLTPMAQWHSAESPSTGSGARRRRKPCNDTLHVKAPYTLYSVTRVHHSAAVTAVSSAGRGCYSGDSVVSSCFPAYLFAERGNLPN